MSFSLRMLALFVMTMSACGAVYQVGRQQELPLDSTRGDALNQDAGSRAPDGGYWDFDGGGLPADSGLW